MTNPFRNEIEITLGQNKYKLRSDFNAIAELEEYLDCSLGEILLNMSRGKTRMVHWKAIVAYGCKGAGVDVNDKQLEEDLADTGIKGVMEAVGPFINQAFNGAPQVEKKVTAKK